MPVNGGKQEEKIRTIQLGLVKIPYMQNRVVPGTRDHGHYRRILKLDTAVSEVARWKHTGSNIATKLPMPGCCRQVG